MLVDLFLAHLGDLTVPGHGRETALAGVAEVGRREAGLLVSRALELEDRRGLERLNFAWLERLAANTELLDLQSHVVSPLAPATVVVVFDHFAHSRKFCVAPF